jgi:hypothetical protein
MSLPTLIVFIDRQPAKRLTDIHRLQDLAEQLDQHLAQHVAHRQATTSADPE